MRQDNAQAIGKRPRRPIQLLLAILPALCCFLLAVACEETPEVTPTPAPATDVEQGEAAPTLVYDGHFPVGYPSPVPIIYVMNDYSNQDWSAVDAAYGPLGGWANWSWYRIHTGPGQFNWAPIEEYLAKSAKYTVTLRDGAVISKPIAITIQVFPEPGADNTPEWVYRKISGSPTFNGRLVGQIIDPDGEGSCPPLAAPAWGNATWRQYFDEMVMALGARYNDDPRINSIWIATGLYGETVIEKSLYTGCGTYVFGSGDFFTWVRDRVLPVYRKAFPTKPLYIINTGGGCLRRDTSAIASSFPVRIGIKHNSLSYDLRGEYDVLGCGKMETINPYSDTTPIAFEHAFAANPWQVYWSTMNGLAHHADLFDLPYDANGWDILDVLARLKGLLHGYDQWEFVERYLGRSLNNSPGVWILFRDTQWPRDYGLVSGGRCLPYQRWDWGEEGRDWEFWLHRKDAAGGRALPLVQPPTRGADECDPVFPNSYSRYYQEVPPALLPDFNVDYPWSEDGATIKETVRAKLYGYYAFRRTNEPSDPHIYLDVNDGWHYWGNLPLAEPFGTAVYTATVIYLDKGTDTWTLAYTDYAGQRQERTVRKTDTQQWKVAVWRISDMYLNNGMPEGVDLLLSSNGDGNDYFHMFLLEAEGRAASMPAPAPTVPPNLPVERVEDLQDRTQSLEERFQEILRIFSQFGSP